MKKTFVPALITLTLASCSTNVPADKGHTDTVLTTTTAPPEIDSKNNLLADTLKVKLWITNVIESYTNSEDPETAFEDLRNSLTENYYDYKQDAINLQYNDGDTSLNEEAFKKKWQDKYNIKLVGSGGFIISAQDNGTVKVIDCNLLKMDQNASVYKVAIEDQDFKARFNRDITVISRNGRLLIDDIREYD